MGQIPREAAADGPGVVLKKETLKRKRNYWSSGCCSFLAERGMCRVAADDELESAVEEGQL